jgi:pseudouridine synthase
VKERLQKILAAAGYGSRRSAEALIAAGRVRVNGEIVRTPGVQADRASDRIEVDGLPLSTSVTRAYLAMHKPAGYTTTARDPHARRTVMELLPEGLPPHMLPVGRLDRDTEGLLLFTNDGELAYRLSHPRYAVDKEYLVLVTGSPSARALARLRRGVLIEGERTAPARAGIARAPSGHATPPGETWLRLTIHEGRKRQVRRMCAAVGHPVRTLVRVRVGGVSLGPLPRGKTRRLSTREVDELRQSVGL